MSGHTSASMQPVQDDQDRRMRVAPVIVVAVLGVLLVVVIAIGVITSRPGSGSSIETVTIAELRANPSAYDNRSVRLEGTIEGVREVPYLSQYAVYTLRDDTGTMYVLTQNGAPPSDPANRRYRLEAIYHSRVTLDDELRRIVEDRLGPVAGEIVVRLFPGVPINVVFLEHQSYEPVGGEEL